MALHRAAAILVAVLVTAFTGPAWSQTQNDGTPREACLSAAESRDLFVADRLTPPFQVMRETARGSQAEAIDIQLCRVQGALVYDVTLLGPQGRLFHRLTNATNGAIVAAPPRPVTPPRPVFQGQRPGPNFYPGAADGFPERRFGAGPFQGQRLGPNFYPGSRPGPPFFPGARSGFRGPGPME